MLSKLQAGKAGRSKPARARSASVVAAVAAVAGVAAAAPAAAGDGKDTFEGSCEFPVTVRFDPPLTNSTQPVHATADAEGRCSGTWRTSAGKKRRLDDARVVYHAESDGEQSCATSGNPTGRGFLLYRDHKLKFRFSEIRVTAPAAVRLEGKRGGELNGTATPTGDEDLAEILEKCASTGLEEAEAIVSGSTNPTISG